MLQQLVLELPRGVKLKGLNFFDLILNCLDKKEYVIWESVIVVKSERECY